MRYTPSTSDCLEALSHTEWYTATEVGQRISEFKKKEVVQGIIYGHLRQLEREGFAISREELDDNKRLRMRGNRPWVTYRITEDGLRHRINGRIDSGLQGRLTPQYGT